MAPRVLFNDIKKNKTLSSSSIVYYSGMLTTTIAIALQKANCATDNAGVEGAIASWRIAAPDVSEDEVCYFIALKGPLARKKTNPFGFLVACVTNCLKGDLLPAYRKDRAVEVEQRLANERRSEIAAREIAADEARRKMAEAAWAAMPVAEQERKIKTLMSEIQNGNGNSRYTHLKFLKMSEAQLLDCARRLAIEQLQKSSLDTFPEGE